MNPWIHLDTAQIPGGGELKLMQRGQDYSIMSGNIELMNSRLYGSEVALFKLAWAKAASRQAPRVLIGGLGMGFTLRAAVADLPKDARIVVSELVPEVIAWGGGHLGGLYGDSLSDPRVKIVRGDVADQLVEPKPLYDMILMDVDNGPDGLNRDANDSLYSLHGLTILKRAVTPGGVVSIWSAAPDDKFARRFAHAGFTVTEHKVGASPSGKGPKHVIWVGVAR
ncbi:MAG: spermidine synthase [Alphaproteobacteria bacterium]|nr:spermidine synthase [Alphaproteobacteria bacterium]MBU1516005.1 spermidine synthase [Alphaproteobacteria bacterium]MBU2092780.1 spermidine synthase [Alphaproteobacteria bacterium]MBU2153695.1 spermidine synthase [Alphaproteobacteria bacterium]MBU2308323.1 spermidine synthase [Alphaproteobacteria bacterium]